MGYGDSLAIWGTSNATIRPGLSDPPSGTTTYGPWFTVPAINNFQASAIMISDDSKGDNTIVATASRLQGWDIKLGMGLESFLVMGAILGGTVANSGTVPNLVSTHSYALGQKPNWFEISMQASGEDDSPLSGITRTFFKCKLTKTDTGNQTEKFAQPSYEFRCIPRKSDGLLHLFTIEQTQTPLVVGATSLTPPTVVSIVPANNATGINSAVSIVITFSEALNVSQASDPGYYYLAAAVAGTSVPFTVSYNPATFVSTLTPASALGATTAYLAGVTPALQDLFGNRLAAQYSSKFTTT